MLAVAETAAMANLKGDWRNAITCCARALELAERYGMKVFGSWTKSAFGRALLATGQVEKGVQLLREGYLAWTALAGIASTAYAADAADALLDAERRDEAIEFMRSGEKIQHDTGEVYQAALFLLMRGRLAQLDGDAAAAEASYRRAIETAQQQGALLYALRAATALAQLCQSLGRAEQADAMLRTIYEKFTEGFDYPDLIRARAVLHDV